MHTRSLHPLSELLQKLEDSELVLQETQQGHAKESEEWEEVKMKLETDLTKLRQNLISSQERNAMFGNQLEELEKQLEANKSQATTAEQNLNASTLQCSTLQVQSPLSHSISLCLSVSLSHSISLSFCRSHCVMFASQLSLSLSETK
jgi:DNA repair exonuclease SbcCD ATPase subunit